MKSSNTFAAIDIGSFNCRLIVVQRLKNKLKILYNYSRETNLIKHIAFNNEFSPKKISQTLKCLQIISKKLKNLKINNYRCIATEACRQVINPDFFLNEVKIKTGLNVEIISSYEEGRLSYEGCKSYCNNTKERGLIFDIGGGSTELTFFNQPNINFFTKSSSYGVINLSEKNEIFGESYVKNQIQKYVNDIKKKLQLNKIKLLAIGSCSTMTSLCAIFLKLKFFDPKRIEGQVLSINDLNQTCEAVLNLTLDEKLKHPCIGRRHVLLDNGIYILKCLIEEIPIKEIVVTNKGLRQGMINDYFGL